LSRQPLRLSSGGICGNDAFSSQGAPDERTRCGPRSQQPQFFSVAPNPLSWFSRSEPERHDHRNGRCRPQDAVQTARRHHQGIDRSPHQRLGEAWSNLTPFETDRMPWKYRFSSIHGTGIFAIRGSIDSRPRFFPRSKSIREQSLFISKKKPCERPTWQPQ